MLAEVTDQWLQEAEALARNSYPKIRVSSRCVVAAPLPGLLAASKEADLVVVGASSSSANAGPSAEEIPLRLAANADCPVVVVPGMDDTDAERRAAPVVAGMTGAGSGEPTVLRAALGAASARWVDMLIVRDGAAELDDGSVGRGVGPSGGPAGIASSVPAELRERFRAVHVRTVAAAERLVEALLRSAADAVLLVISAGNPAAAASGQAVLGRLLRESSCPVMVIPNEGPAVPAGGRRDDALGRRRAASGQTVTVSTSRVRSGR